jgi:anthranilate phosphoribosyltransferase
VLAGETGPYRDIVLLNAGAGIYAAGQADSIAEGIGIARQALDTGAAAAVVDRLVAASNRMAQQKATA